MNEPSDVEFTVYDLSGRILIQKTVNSDSSNSSGIQMINWDGVTQQGSRVGRNVLVQNFCQPRKPGLELQWKNNQTVRMDPYE